MKLLSRSAWLLAVVSTWGLWQTASARQDTEILPIKDNTLYESAAGSVSNGAGAHLFAGRTREGALRRAVLAFDVAGAVPAGAVIDSVALTLNLSRTAGGSQTIAVHRVLADWGEGASDAPNNEGQGAAAVAGDATWVHRFFNTTAWQNTGGDFAPAASASVLVGDAGAYTWTSTPTLVADVQAWLDAPEDNFGWILLGNEEDALTAKRFDSRENPNATARPRLRVFYVVPTATEPEVLPGTLRLAQNYPNPFTQTTTISYTVSVPQSVTLEVYDLLGRTVMTLAQGRRAPGLHRVAFDARGLPEGVYIYRLSADGFSQNRKMILLR